MTQDVKFSYHEHVTYENGFAQPVPTRVHNDGAAEGASYVDPVALPLPTSTMGSDYGVFHEHTYPTLLNGTNCPQGPPKWFKKEKEVDVLICGGM